MGRGPSDRIEIATHTTGPREVIAIGIPSFGMVHLLWTARLYNMRFPMNRIVRQFYCVGKEVGEARNEIAAKALQVEIDDPTLRCTKLLFLDDDVLFHPDLLLQLLSRNRQIVSGLYYSKSTIPTPLVLHDAYQGVATSWRPGDLVDCAGHGMGLCLMDTDILRRIRDERDVGTDSHGYPSWFKTTKDATVLGADGVVAQHSQTEDMHFLAHVKALGYQPCVDTSAAAFGFHLDTKLMRVYPEKQWQEYQDHGRITWETDHGPVAWEHVA
jgi:hypothetical protein